MGFLSKWLRGHSDPTIKTYKQTHKVTPKKKKKQQTPKKSSGGGGGHKSTPSTAGWRAGVTTGTQARQRTGGTSSKGSAWKKPTKTYKPKKTASSNHTASRPATSSKPTTAGWRAGVTTGTQARRQTGGTSSKASAWKKPTHTYNPPVTSNRKSRIDTTHQTLSTSGWRAGLTPGSTARQRTSGRSTAWTASKRNPRGDSNMTAYRGQEPTIGTSKPHHTQSEIRQTRMSTAGWRGGIDADQKRMEGAIHRNYDHKYSALPPTLGNGLAGQRYYQRNGNLINTTKQNEQQLNEMGKFNRKVYEPYKKAVREKNQVALASEKYMGMRTGQTQADFVQKDKKMDKYTAIQRTPEEGYKLQHGADGRAVNMAATAVKSWAADQENAAATVLEATKGLGLFKNGPKNNPAAKAAKKLRKQSDAMATEATYNDDLAKKGLGAVGRFAVDAATQTVQMGMDFALTGGKGSIASIFTRSFGGTARQARKEGASTKQQVLAGLSSGAVEALTEKMFGTASPTYGKGAFDSLGEGITKKVGKKIAESGLVNKLTRGGVSVEGATKLAKFGLGVLEEGAEEAVSDAAQPAWEAVTYKGKKALKQYAQKQYYKNMARDAALGSATAGIMGGGNLAVERAISNTTGRSVVKLSNEDKTAVLDQAETDLPDEHPAKQRAAQLRRQQEEGYAVTDEDVAPVAQAVIDNFNEQTAREYEAEKQRMDAEELTDQNVAGDTSRILTKDDKHTVSGTQAQVNKVMRAKVERTADEVKTNLMSKGYDERTASDSALSVARMSNGTATNADYSKLGNREIAGQVEEMINSEVQTRAEDGDDSLLNIVGDNFHMPDTPQARVEAVREYGNAVNAVDHDAVLEQANDNLMTNYIDFLTDDMEDGPEKNLVTSTMMNLQPDQVQHFIQAYGTIRNAGIQYGMENEEGDNSSAETTLKKAVGSLDFKLDDVMPASVRDSFFTLGVNEGHAINASTYENAGRLAGLDQDMTEEDYHPDYDENQRAAWQRGFQQGRTEREETKKRQTEVEEERKNDKDFKAGDFTIDDDAVHDVSKADKDMLQALATEVGVNIHVVKTLNSMNGYRTNDGIVIAADATEPSLVIVACHEVTHELKARSPEMFAEYQRFVMDAWYNKDADSYNRAVETTKRRYKEQAGQELSTEQAEEELLSDRTGDLMRSDEMIDRLCEDYSPLAKRVFAGVKRIARRIHNALTYIDESGQYHDSNRGFFNGLDIVDGAADRFAAVIADATSTNEERQGTAEETTKAESRETSVKQERAGPEKRYSLKDYHVDTDDVMDQIHDYQADHEGDDVFFGFRIDPTAYKVGDTVARSHDWWQDDTGEGLPYNEDLDLYDAGELDGTSTVGINPDGQDNVTPKMVEKALKEMEPYATADNLLLVASDEAYGGNDIGEVIITDPEVLSVWKKGTGVEERRFQLKDVDQKKMQRKIDRLEQKTKDLKAELKRTQGNVPKKAAVNKMVKDFVQRYGVDVDAATEDLNYDFTTELTNTINNEYNAIKDGVSVENLRQIREDAMNIAGVMVDNMAATSDELKDTYYGLKNYFKGATIKVPDEDTGRLTRGEWSNVQREYRNVVRMSKTTGKGIDGYWNELCDMFPGFFDRNITNPTDQTEALLDTIDTLRDYTFYPYKSGVDEDLVMDVATDLLGEISALPQNKTYADIQFEKRQKAVQRTREQGQNRYQKLKEKDQKKFEKFKQEKDEQRNKAIQKVKDHHQKMIDNLRERDNQRLQRQEAYYRNRIRENEVKRKDKHARKKFLNQIKTYVKWISDGLLKPTDIQHMPAGYADAIAKMLSSLDFTTKTDARREARGQEPTKKTINYRALRETYKDLVAKADSSEGITVNQDTADLLDTLDDIAQQNGGSITLDELSTEDLETVKDLLHHLQHELRYDSTVTINGRTMRAEDEAKAAVWEATEYKTDRREFGGMFGALDHFLNGQEVTPSHMFKIIGGTLQDAYKDLRRGLNKHEFHIKQTEDFYQNTVLKIASAKEIKKWHGDKAKGTEFKLESGKTITMTPAQVMSLYCISKREQGMRHIIGDGIKVTSHKASGLRGKLGELDKSVRVRPTAADMKMIFDSMTPEQVKVADALQKFMSTVCAEWGNETSRLLYGYDKFVEEFYFPLSTEQSPSSSLENGKKSPKLKNSGMTKQTNEFARNTIFVSDIFDVFAKHVNQMSEYGTLVPGIDNLEKILNYKYYDAKGELVTVQDVLADAYGRVVAGGDKGKTNEKGYIYKFLDRLNGDYVHEDLTISKKLVSNYKRARIGINIRVLMQQPTSITRALTVMSPVDLFAAGNTNLKKGRKNKLEHSGIANWKADGHINMDVSREMDDIILGKKNLADQIESGAYGVADNITWDVLWNATEHEIRRKNKNLKVGSDEYWQAVSDRYDEIIDLTQVVDSPFHRSELMASKSFFTNIMTAFQAEPTVTYNCIHTSICEAANNFKKGNYKEGAAQLTRMGLVTVAAAGSTAFAAAFMDAIREAAVNAWSGDDDDKDKDKQTFWQRWLSNAKKDWLGNLNPIAMIPGVHQIASIWDGYDSNVMALSGIEESVKAIQEWMKGGESTKGFYLKVRNSLRGISDVIGVPVYNLMRDAESFGFIIAGRKHGKAWSDYWHDYLAYDISNEHNAGRFVKDYQEALKVGNDPLANTIRNKLLEAKVISAEDLNKKSQNAFKDIYKKALVKQDTAKIAKYHDLLIGTGLSEVDVDKLSTDTLNKFIADKKYSDAESFRDYVVQQGMIGKKAAKETVNKKALNMIGSYTRDAKWDDLKELTEAAKEEHWAKGADIKDKIASSAKTQMGDYVKSNDWGKLKSYSDKLDKENFVSDRLIRESTVGAVKNKEQDFFREDMDLSAAEKFRKAVVGNKIISNKDFYSNLAWENGRGGAALDAYQGAIYMSKRYGGAKGKKYEKKAEGFKNYILKHHIMSAHNFDLAHDNKPSGGVAGKAKQELEKQSSSAIDRLDTAAMDRITKKMVKYGFYSAADEAEYYRKAMWSVYYAAKKNGDTKRAAKAKRIALSYGK